MKKLILSTVIALAAMACYGQENIFSVGYGKTFVKKDSSTISATLQINNVPGSTSSPGNYYMANNIINDKWGWYLKPAADINLGSATASAPNNVSFSTPIGFSYDFDKTGDFIITGYIEAAPAMVADRDFKNTLYYGVFGEYLKGATTSKAIEFTFLTGPSFANGVRDQTGSDNHTYSRLGLPVYLTFSCWHDVYKHGNDKPKDFKRLTFKHTFKYNRIFNDDPAVMSRNDYFFNSAEADFYIIPTMGIKLTYNNGFDEPVFVNNNAYTIGIVFAKK